MVRLVLFDIDGTLIRSGGAGVRAFERTFAEVFERPGTTSRLKFAGRTDLSLVREGLALHGIEANEANFHRFFESYPKFLAELLPASKGGVCEGIHHLIHQLQHSPKNPVLGLLTGNIRRGAELKLRHYQLWHHFQTGAFADDHEDRNCIASVAQQRGSEYLGNALAGEEILVIGDTPHDITCGRSIGARVLAVGTGEFSREELSKSHPTWAVDHVGQIDVPSLLGTV